MDLLFLCHRIPYPPDKGEKIRAWHMLRHLARRHAVHLGCFFDDPDDAAHVAMLRGLCADVCALPIDRSRRKLAALAGIRPGEALTLGYFRDARLAAWVAGKLAGGIAHAFVYCSAMAQYVMAADGARIVLDMVDVDSEKWAEYAARAAWPARLVWAREARTLQAFERAAARRFDATLLVSAPEAARFAAIAPESAARIGWIGNGVDLDHFAPGEFAAPGPPGANIVFVGTMDYRPNIDAVAWFAADVLPRLAAHRPVFHIVGASPAAEVVRLAGAQVRVTGRVDDVRPYLAHAGVVVAPLRIARGIQNKVLEAMAMGCPVVASPQAFEGIEARPGRDLLVADGAPDMADAVAAVLDGAHRGLGAAARATMVARYGWEARLAGLDAVLEGPCTAAA